MGKPLTDLQRTLLETLKGLPRYWWSIHILATDMGESHQAMVDAAADLARLGLLERQRQFYKLPGAS